MEVSTKELCDILGVTKAAVSQWKSAGLPCHGGKWDIAEVIQWRKDREQEPSDMAVEKLRYWAAKAERETIRAQQEQGELIPVKEAKQLWGAVLVNFTRRLEVMPIKLAPLAYGLSIPEIKAITEKMIYEIRMELSDPDLSLAAITAILQERKEKQKSKKIGKRK